MPRPNKLKSTNGHIGLLGARSVSSRPKELATVAGFVLRQLEMSGHVVQWLEQVHPHPGNRQQLGTLHGILDLIGSRKAVKGSAAVF
jgi:hypothetical protein